MNWPKRINWLWVVAGFIIGFVLVAVFISVISSATGSLQNGYGKQLNEAGKE